MPDIDINGFSGANNIKEDERFFVKRGIAEPRVILNADVDITGKLVKRPGKTLFWALTGAHSLWAGKTCMLCAAQGSLYRNIGSVAVNVGTIAGPDRQLSHVEAEDKVYISNQYWQGVFDPSTNSVSSWGGPLPPGPMLLSGDGNLPAGQYHVCMTNVESGRLSGNGPVSAITLSAEGGIRILNRPPGALVWATDTNEGTFYLAGEIDNIVDLPAIEPLPSFLCSPPPYLENLCYAFGRIWGSSGSTVYYSEPFKLEWFKQTSNRFDFEDEVVLIARVTTGLFVGLKSKTTYFLMGTEPSKMTQQVAGSGAVKGSLAYCDNMPYLADVLGTEAKVFSDVPMWLSEDGLVVGNAAGRVFNLTNNKLNIGGTPEQGSSLCRNLNGVLQLLTSFKGGTAAGEDTDTYNAFKNGQIDVHNEREEDMGCRAAFCDTAICQVFRGGVEI